MEVDLITNHLELALSRRLEQYKDTPNIESILTIYSNQYQELENVIFSLQAERALATAFGFQLDLIGTIVGLARQGKTDDVYKRLLNVKIGQNISQSDPVRIVNVFKLITEATAARYINVGGGNLMLEFNTTLPDQDSINFVFENMQKVVAAGVRVANIVSVDPDLAFAFDGPVIDPTAGGFDDGTGTVGGKFAIDYEYILPFAFDGSDEATGGFGAGPDDPLVGGGFVA